MEQKKVKLQWISNNDYIATTSYGSLQVGESYHRPMELLLVALGGCMGVDISTILRKKRQDIKDINIEVLGERKEDFPRVYENIKIVCHVKGDNLNRKAVEDTVNLSISKYCSVYAMLSKASNIEVEIKIWED